MDTRNITRFFKGIAIFLVVLCHSHQTFTLPGSLNEILSFGQVGVQLFILLSSMGLCFSYSRSPVNWLGFMKKRASKIVILYWFAIVLAAIYRVTYALVMHENVLQALNPLGILVNMFFLHGFSFDETINNKIVRGGWFIGTLVIIYAIFPFIYRLYFQRNKTWEKIRIFVFPLGVFVTTSIIVGITKYFAFPEVFEKLFLQLAPFSLGFPLFELQNKCFVKEIKFPLCKGLIFATLASVLYFTETKVKHFYTFSITIAFFYFIMCVLKSEKMHSVVSGKSIVCRFFNALGQYSFHIYLTHSYIAFDFCYLSTAILSLVYANDLFWFILLQPFVIVLSYYTSKVFNTVVNIVVSKSRELAN